MLIFDEHNKPMILDSIHGPTVTEYLWILDMNLLEFTLAPLAMLEENVCPSLKLEIRGSEIILPASWNILIFDPETAQLDVTPVSQVPGREFTAFVYGPTKFRHEPATVTAIDYYVEYKNVGPSLNKHQMLCHPISSDEWIVVSGSDGFNKYLKHAGIADIIG